MRARHAEAGKVQVGCRVIAQAQGLMMAWVRTDDMGVDWTGSRGAAVLNSMDHACGWGLIRHRHDGGMT